MFLFAAFFLVALQSGARGQECACSSTGVSNGVDTGSPGCRLASATASEPTCFVESSYDCPEAVSSFAYPGASSVSCSVREALIYAAEVDDVDSIVRFRRRGADIDITVDVGGQTHSLLSYAAAHGSFGVVEDLISNEDYECFKGVSPSDAICTLSDAPKCGPSSREREDVNALIEDTYDAECAPAERAFIPPTVPASCGGHPYFVSVRSSAGGGSVHRCGGVLIYSDTVMTAAHCVDSPGAYKTTVMHIETYSLDGRNSQCAQTSETRRARKIVTHSKWKKGPFRRALGNPKDVALIKLDSPSSKRPIKIASSKPLVGESLRFVGLGSSGGGGFSQELQIQTIKAAKLSKCKSAYAPRGVANKILCVGGSDKDFCHGDDGGPLFRRKSTGDELVGIAHMKHATFGCGATGVPGLYANVPGLKKWIAKQRKKNSWKSA